MKLKIEIKLNTIPAPTSNQKAPFDRRKIMVFISCLIAPLLLFTGYYLAQNSIETVPSIKRVVSKPEVTIKEETVAVIESQPTLVEEGNVEVMAAVAVLEAPKLETQVTLEVIEPVQVNSKPQPAPELIVIESESALESENIINDKLVRGVLTSGIVNREPVDNIGSELKGALSHKVYFFSEIHQMAGLKIYHRWLLNERLVANVELHIGGDRWRTYSNKNISKSMTGQWRVEVVDSEGTLLTTHKFDYYH